MRSRLRRLEIEKIHPILAQMGGMLGGRHADVRSGSADGRYDRRDVPTIMLRKSMGASVRIQCCSQLC